MLYTSCVFFHKKKKKKKKIQCKSSFLDNTIAAERTCQRTDVYALHIKRWKRERNWLRNELNKYFPTDQYITKYISNILVVFAFFLVQFEHK